MNEIELDTTKEGEKKEGDREGDGYRERVG
jgi:hypothetical protein